ncbi:hypothetical protein ACJDT4_10685 [Clostridium neuense]|uniref:Uncharacterized protein n=1 Tax=Clostridium neuense TaxID=1728934 RepID=A0ABW8TEK8_9CLOT
MDNKSDNKTFNKTIISKFIMKEVEQIYMKYSAIEEEELNIVADFIRLLEENKIDFDPYVDYRATKAMAYICKDISDVELIRFYLFLRYDISLDVEVKEAEKAYKSLNEYGYTEVQNYYVYYKDKEEAVIELAKEVLNKKLEDSDEVTAMFDEEELAYMWIFNTSKNQAGEEYLSEHGWKGVLEVGEVEEGYVNSEGKEVLYCYKDI